MNFRYAMSIGGGQVEMVFEDNVGKEVHISVDKRNAMKMMQLVPIALRDEVAREKDEKGAHKLFFIPVAAFQLGGRLDHDEVVIHVLGDTSIFYNLLAKRRQVDSLISLLLQDQAAHRARGPETKQ